MATGDKKLLQIIGRVIERKTKNPVAGLTVEAWDKDAIIKTPIGSAITDQDGAFAIEIKKPDLKNQFAPRTPVLSFRVFRDQQPVPSNGDSVIWSLDEPDKEVAIKADIADQPQPPVQAQPPAKPQPTVQPQPPVQPPTPTQPAPSSNQPGEPPTQPPAQNVGPITVNIGPQTLTIRGFVRREDGGVVTSGLVRAVRQTAQGQLPVGQPSTIAGDGSYLITHIFDPPLDPNLGISLLLFAFDGKGNPIGSADFNSNVLVLDPRIDFTIPAEEKPPEPPKPEPARTFTVEGQVKKGSQPLGNATVKAFDGSSTSTPFRIVQSSSDSSNLGHYVITYLVGPAPSDFTSAPRLVIRAFDGSAVGESALGRPALEHETMDVVIPDSPPPPGDFFVEGHVRSGEFPVVGSFVQALDLGVGLRTLLGTKTTD